MSALHSQTIADHLLATGEQMSINGEEVFGKKRLLTYKDSGEIELQPKIVAYRVSVPKERMEWVPRQRATVEIDGADFTVGSVADLVAYWRFDITRYVG